MMEIKAIRSFGGAVTMRIGELREVPKEIAADLIAAGYAEDVKRPQKPKKEAQP